VVLRVKRVRHPDVVCIECIEHFLREQTARGVTSNTGRSALRYVRRVEQRRSKELVPHRAALPRKFSATLKAVRYAHNKLAEPNLAEPVTAVPELAVHPRLYYLV